MVSPPFLLLGPHPLADVYLSGIGRRPLAGAPLPHWGADSWPGAASGWGAATSQLPRLAAGRSASARVPGARLVVGGDWARYAASAPDGGAALAIGPYLCRLCQC
jgi:hypothetical protein